MTFNQTTTSELIYIILFKRRYRNNKTE